MISNTYSKDFIKKSFSTLKYGTAYRVHPGNENVVVLEGKEVLDFLHRITTQSLKSLPDFHHRFTVFTNNKGRILDRVHVLNPVSKVLLITGSKRKNLISHWIERYIINDDVKINNILQYSVVDFYGEQTPAFLSWLFPGIEVETLTGEIKTAYFQNRILYILKTIDIEGRTLFRIIADNSQLERLVTYIEERKEPFDVLKLDEELFDIYRIKEGIPSEAEFMDDYNPHEAGIISDVDFKKGCYIGQEVIARLDTYDKVQKYLKKITIPVMVDPHYNPIIFNQDNLEVGKLTSLAFYPLKEITVGLGYVKKDWLSQTHELHINSESGTLIKISIEKR